MSNQSGPDIALGTDDEFNESDFQAGVLTPDDMDWVGNQEAEVIVNPDTKVGKAPRSLKTGPRAPEETMAPKTGIPTVDEWHDFFSRVLLRAGTDWLIDWTFRGIDEELLTDREVETIKLTDEERKRIAKPLSEMAYKNRFMRKHGREIIATAGSIDAILQLGLWYSRINRIALKYRKLSKQGMRTQSRGTPTTIPTEVITDERPGSSPPNQTANGNRPDVAGPVWNPDRA